MLYTYVSYGPFYCTIVILLHIYVRTMHCAYQLAYVQVHMCIRALIVHGIFHSLVLNKYSVVVFCRPMPILASLVLRVTFNMHPLQKFAGLNTQPLCNVNIADIPAEGETLQVTLALEGKFLLVFTGTVITLPYCPLLITVCTFWVKYAV